MNFSDDHPDLEALGFWTCFGSTQQGRLMFGSVLLMFGFVAAAVAWWGSALVEESWALVMVFPLCLAVGSMGAKSAVGAVRLSSQRRLPNTVADTWLRGWRGGQWAFAAVAVVLAGLLAQGSLMAFSVGCLWAAVGHVAGTWSGLRQGAGLARWVGPVLAALLVALFLGGAWRWQAGWPVELSVALVSGCFAAGLLSSWLALRRLRGAAAGRQSLAPRHAAVQRVADPWGWWARGRDSLKRRQALDMPSDAKWYQLLSGPANGFFFFGLFYDGLIVTRGASLGGVRMQELWSTRLGFALVMTAMFRSALSVERVHWRHWLLPGSARRVQLGQRVFKSSAQIYAGIAVLWVIGAAIWLRDSGALWEVLGTTLFRSAYVLFDACLALAFAVCWGAWDEAHRGERIGVPALAVAPSVLFGFGLLVAGVLLGLAPRIVPSGAWPLWTSGGLWWAIPSLVASAWLVKQADHYWATRPTGFVILPSPSDLKTWPR